MPMEIISVAATDSTNNLVRKMAGDGCGECLVYAFEQTAGRGQRGNTWESEPGKNLTASLLLFPSGIAPSEQFLISEAVALAVVDILSGQDVEAMVKWPNDIYVGDRKICGILIEHAIMGHSILHTVAGVGLNLNQTIFKSDAPNPVSLMQLTGRETDVDDMARNLANAVNHRLSSVRHDKQFLHEEFLTKLWRGDGRVYPFLDRQTGREFMGRIGEVALDGIITIYDEENLPHPYAFKEVEFLLE